MQKLLNVKAVKLWRYGKDVSLTFKVFPPTIIQELKKQWNSYECRTVRKVIPSQLYSSFKARLVGSCNDSMGEFIRRTFNTVTLLKFTGHWDVMGLVRHERQTNVFPKNMSQELTVQKSLAMVGWRIRNFCGQLNGLNLLNSSFTHGFAPASYSITTWNPV